MNKRGFPVYSSGWDTGRGADGKGSTANFVSGLLGALPPLHEVARQAGLDLPFFLGTTSPAKTINAEQATSASDIGSAASDQSPWQRAYTWALSNHQSLLAFDSNRDGKLSVDDVSTAVGKALRWASMVDDPTLQWNVSDGKGTTKTLSWNQIASLPATATTQIGLSLPASAADSGTMPLEWIQAIRG